eukprot:11068810-Ditylum_brightwellii.AAC.1
MALRSGHLVASSREGKRARTHAECTHGRAWRAVARRAQRAGTSLAHGYTRGQLLWGTSQIYALCRGLGLQYGPVYQVLEGARGEAAAAGGEEVHGRIYGVPRDPSGASYVVPPSFLDGCFQLLVLLSARQTSEEAPRTTMVPAMIDAFGAPELRGHPSLLECSAKMCARRGASEAISNHALWEATASWCATVRGLHAKPYGQHVRTPHLDASHTGSSAYTVDMVVATVATRSPQPPLAGRAVSAISTMATWHLRPNGGCQRALALFQWGRLPSLALLVRQAHSRQTDMQGALWAMTR